ncbi:replication restart helicase PriA [Vampirovibrio chlorellavorus]|uniref:replication restart helicase PriA n=1 Tax=Vampirovibrio chlorellavorus TaxID=758823 RepID=UPI0026F10E0B|nr:primosomal protein N' [Vampirovibrio chlorellavorus]
MNLPLWETILQPETPDAPPETLPRYAEVLVNMTAKGLQSQVFTYQVPEEFREVARVGQPVLVSFGAQQDLTGFIVGLSADYTGHYKLKELSDILDETPLFDAEYYDFIQWVADYYATPLPQVLACALPANLVQRPKKLVYQGPNFKEPLMIARIPNEVARKALQLIDFLYKNAATYEELCGGKNAKGYSPKYLAGHLRMPVKAMNQLLARLRKLDIVVVETELSAKTRAKTVKRVTLNADKLENAALSTRQQEIVTQLKDRPEGLPLKELLDVLGTTPPTVKKLEAAGVITITEVAEHRDPLALFQKLAARTHFTLSRYQQQAMDTVVNGDSEQPYLLYGITGSGKTEVYMSMTRHALERGKAVLMMVPEIALTSQIARRFINHFGSENIALWHSNLSDGEKADTWHKLRTGELKILIGARSAIWAPIKDLELILIDEEHEGSFKQDSPAPRYNAKTLALELARRTGAKVVLGSATPEISTFYQAQRDGRILHLPERFGNSQLAEVRVVDMKQERGQGHQGQLSRSLIEELKVNLEAGEQSIILLNRRGFYTTIQCTVCDHVFQCPNCDVAVTFHRTRNQVCCHYCGYESERPAYCPVCASMELSHSGVGTQRIEDEVIQKFPEARVLRLDSDVLQRKNAYVEIFETFAAGEADILIGTQIVAKGLDVANVTLVGVVSADSAFCLPDYKSAERGFQLLTQVAGRAGRGQKPGRVIIQSVQTQHMVLTHAKNQDYPNFYTEEIVQRELCGFPPYSQIFRFIVSCENEKKAQQFIQAATLHLREQIQAADGELGKHMTLMGPAPCVLPRIQNKFRLHLLIKNFAGAAGHRLITEFYRRATENRLPEDLNFILDIDAQSLL